MSDTKKMNRVIFATASPMQTRLPASSKINYSIQQYGPVNPELVKRKITPSEQHDFVQIYQFSVFIQEPIRPENFRVAPDVFFPMDRVKIEGEE